jgi:type II secretory pathway component PulM
MDRNTLTGLVLIGLLLTVFTIINKPTEEELKQQEAEIVKHKRLKQSSKKRTRCWLALMNHQATILSWKKKKIQL